MPMLLAYVAQLPELERLKQLPIAELKWLIAPTLGIKNTKVHDWLTGLARDTVAPYAPRVADAIRLALKLKLVGPLALGEVDLQRLKASGGAYGEIRR